MKRKLTDISHGKFVVSFREVKQNENRKTEKQRKLLTTLQSTLKYLILQIKVKTKCYC